MATDNGIDHHEVASHDAAYAVIPDPFYSLKPSPKPPRDALALDRLWLTWLHDPLFPVQPERVWAILKLIGSLTTRSRRYSYPSTWRHTTSVRHCGLSAEPFWGRCGPTGRRHGQSTFGCLSRLGRNLASLVVLGLVFQRTCGMFPSAPRTSHFRVLAKNGDHLWSLMDRSPRRDSLTLKKEPRGSCKYLSSRLDRQAERRSPCGANIRP